MKLLAIAGISLALTAGVACGSNSTGEARSDGGVGNTTAQDLSASYEISGGSPRQRQLLIDAVEVFVHSGVGMPIREIAIREPPPRNYGGAEDACWLAFQATGADPADGARAQWVALMVAGVLHAKSRQEGLPPLAGLSVRVEGAGAGEENSSGAPEEAVSIAVTPIEEIERRIRDGAEETGAHIESIEFPRPLEAAVVIRLTANEEFVRKRSTNLVEIIGSFGGPQTPRAEGVWVEVRGEDGSLLHAGGYSARLLQGAGWTRPGLHER